MKPYQEEAKFWHSVWISYGRPGNNSLHHIMKTVRNQYHYAVRRAKKNEVNIRKEKYLQQCLNNDTNNIFKELKSKRRINQRPSNIDGVVGGKNIANKLKETYKLLYNSHDDKSETKDILNEINQSVQDDEISEVNKLTPSLIKAMISRMKSGKNDVTYDFRSEALKYGVNQIAPHLSKLFKVLKDHCLRSG